MPRRKRVHPEALLAIRRGPWYNKDPGEME